MPTIEFITKINEEGVIQTFEKISQTIEGAAEAAHKLGNESTGAAETSKISWTQVGVAVAAAGTAMVAAGTSIVAVLFEMAEKTATAGAQMEFLSQKTGLTTEQLSQMSFAAQVNGASIENVMSSLRLLATHMENVAVKGDATGTAFEKLGISATDANGQLRPTADVMLDVADKFATMSDGANKSALAVELFGRGGLAMIPILDQGRAGIAALAEKADALGITFSEKAAKASHEFETSLIILHSAFDGLTFAIGEQAMPIIEKWIDRASSAVVSVKNWVNENPNLAQSLLEVGAALIGGGGLLTAVGGLIVTLPILVGWIGSFAVEAATATEVNVALGASIADVGYETAAATGLMGRFAAGFELVSGFLMGPTGIVLGIAALAAGLIYLIDQTETGHEVLGRFADGIKQTALEVADTIVVTAKFVGTLVSIGQELGKEIIRDASSWYTIFSESVKATTNGLIDLNKTLPLTSDQFQRAYASPNPIENVLQSLRALKPLMESLSDLPPPPPLMPIVPTGAELQAISAQMKAAHQKLIDDLDLQDKAQAGDQRKAQDIFIGYFLDFYKHQYEIGEISSQQLTDLLLTQENNRYANEEHNNTNRAALAAQHEVNLLKIATEGNDRLTAIEMASYDLASRINAERLADSNAAAEIRLSEVEKMKQREFNSGIISSEELLKQDLYLEDQRWLLMTTNHLATESETQAHEDRIFNIELDYADRSLAQLKTDEALRLEFQKIQDNIDIEDRKQAHTKQQTESMNAINAMLDSYRPVIALQNQIDAEWTKSMKHMGDEVANALAGMVVNFQFNADAFVSIAKKTAESMLSAMLQGLITPLTNELAKIGAKITSSLLGIGGNGTSGGIGSILGGLGSIGSGGTGGGIGSLIGNFASEGGKTVTDEFGNLVTTGGTAGSGLLGGIGTLGGFLGSTVGIATMGIGAAVAGIIALVKSQAHHEADDLVQNVQAPFDKNFASMVDMITIEFANGTQNQRDLLIAQVGEHELWSTVSAAVENWRTAKGPSSDRDKVASQFHATEDPFVGSQLRQIDTLANQLYWQNTYRDNTISATEAAQLPRYGGGTYSLANDGPVYAHAGEAIIPAAYNPWNPQNSARQSDRQSSGMITVSFGDIYLNAGSSSDPEAMAEQLMRAFEAKLKRNNGDIQTTIQRRTKVQI